MSDHWFLDLLRDYKESFQLLISATGFIGGGYGLYLLNKRTIATIKSAEAAVTASNAAASASKTAADQAETARKRHESQTVADRERRIVETFAKANEQLTSKETFVRLGAIYTLENISHESSLYYWPVMEILSAYFRKQAKNNQLMPELFKDDQNSMHDDLTAILRVLGRRNPDFMVEYHSVDRVINLTDTDLRPFIFDSSSSYEYIDFSQCNLTDADFFNCNFSDCYFTDAIMHGINLFNKNTFDRAYLHDADLSYADLQRATFMDTNMQGTILKGAYIGGVDLSLSDALVQSQIDDAVGDERTRLPDHLQAPTHWPKVAKRSEWKKLRTLVEKSDG